MPQLTKSVQPELPYGLVQKKISANCIVSLIVNADGTVKDVYVFSSTPSIEDKKLRKLAVALQDSCIKTVQQYAFEPARYQGKPVPVELKVEIKQEMY